MAKENAICLSCHCCADIFQQTPEKVKTFGKLLYLTARENKPAQLQKPGHIMPDPVPHDGLHPHIPDPPIDFRDFVLLYPTELHADLRGLLHRHHPGPNSHYAAVPLLKGHGAASDRKESGDSVIQGSDATRTGQVRVYYAISVHSRRSEGLRSFLDLSFEASIISIFVRSVGNAPQPGCTHRNLNKLVRAIFDIEEAMKGLFTVLKSAGVCGGVLSSVQYFPVLLDHHSHQKAKIKIGVE